MSLLEHHIVYNQLALSAPQGGPNMTVPSALWVLTVDEGSDR